MDPTIVWTVSCILSLVVLVYRIRRETDLLESLGFTRIQSTTSVLSVTSDWHASFPICYIYLEFVLRKSRQSVTSSSSPHYVLKVCFKHYQSRCVLPSCAWPAGWANRLTHLVSSFNTLTLQHTCSSTHSLFKITTLQHQPCIAAHSWGYCQGLGRQHAFTSM